MIGTNQRERFWSGVGRTLAALALFLTVLAPQGLMVARSGDQVFITICSGHGPLTIPAPGDLGGKKAPPAKQTSDASCPFAGHAPSVPVPVAERLPAPLPLRFTDAVARLAATQAPGLGLVAPPPPSRGPPSLLV